MLKALSDTCSLWNRLPHLLRFGIPAAFIAVPTTMFLGQISSQNIKAWAAPHLADNPFALFDWLGNTTMIAIALALPCRGWAMLQARRSARTKLQHDRGAEYRLLDDLALHGNAADELERDRFLETLTRTVVLPRDANSLVLALESPWGSGKTSVLELLCRNLQRHRDNPLVVRFSPWVATGESRLFRAFFSQFSAALLREGERTLAIKLIGFGETLEDLLPSGARAFPRLGFQHVGRLMGQIPIIDLEREKESLSARVTQVGRPIVVVIDDIDRLPPGDIRLVFQLVKAVAAFPRVAYLLAFDPSPIDRALRFGGTYKDGREFRDKIVQANFALPRSRYSTRRTFFVARLKERVEAWNFTLEPYEEARIEASIPLVLSALTTPRDMKRVLNKTLMAADNLRSEVNFADVLLFETLHAKFPKVVDLIRRNPRVVDPAGVGDDAQNPSTIARMITDELESRKQERGDRLRDFTRQYPRDREQLAPLLTSLFPTIFDKESVSSDELAAQRRIALHQNLLKLLYQGLFGELLSAKDAIQFLAKPDDRKPILRDAVESGSLAAWSAHVQQFARSTPTPRLKSLLLDLARAVNQAYERYGTDTSTNARALMLSLLNFAEPAERLDALRSVLTDPEAAFVGEEVLITLLRDAGLWSQGVRHHVSERASARGEFEWLEPNQLDELRQVWLNTMESVGLRHIILKAPNALSVLFRIGQLSDPPNEKLIRDMDAELADPETAKSFSLRFPPGVGIAGIERFLSSAALENLRAVVKSPDVPAVIRERFEEFFAALPHLQANL